MAEGAIGAAIVAALVAIAGFIGWWLNRQREATHMHTQLDIEQTKALLKMIKETHEATRTINDAVNHRRDYKDADGQTPPKLLDQVNRTRLLMEATTARVHQIAGKIEQVGDWMEDYKGSHLPDKEAVNAFVEGTSARLDHHSQEMESINGRLDEIRTWMEENRITPEKTMQMLEDHCKGRCELGEFTEAEVEAIRQHLSKV
jgi:hypothetical protein